LTSTISDAEAGAKFGQLVDQALANNDRFLVERDGEPAVLIMSVSDFVATLAPKPDWIRQVQTEAAASGADKLSMAEIEAEITAARRERRDAPN
jgi:PHD/YefM family antitoxin component YafN of YafNO toxin-antitoxin module